MKLFFIILFFCGIALLYFSIKRYRFYLTCNKFLQTKEIYLSHKENYSTPSIGSKIFHLFYSQISGLNKKWILIILACILAILILNHLFLQISPILAFFIGLVFGIYLVNFLRNKEIANDFETNFPELLVTLNGAISAGSNIIQALNDCSNSINGALKYEIKIIVKSLEIGDDPSKVFQASYARLPFKSYYFFLTALLVSLKSGAKLKEILSRLSTANTKAKAIEKKKNAMTSEARMSSKITAFIPFFFLFVMKFISPENFDFILHDEKGRYILYYFLGSEFIGILIIMFLMRKI